MDSLLQRAQSLFSSANIKVPSIRTLAKSLALAPSAQQPWSPQQATSPSTRETCANPVLSCPTIAAPSCCFESPGGHLLLTQFWDANPATGPDDSWTIHGLWPDHCNGGFDSSCDSSRAYRSIGTIIQDAGLGDLFAYINTYWKAIDGKDEILWEHEWSKHGTCINTIKPDCYTNYTKYDEMIDYIQIVVELFKDNPTYETLSAVGIIPSESARYTVNDIQSALSAAHGEHVTLGCSHGQLNQVFYHYNIKGPVASGNFVAAAPDGKSRGTCHGRIRYLPKASRRKETKNRESGDAEL